MGDGKSSLFLVGGWHTPLKNMSQLGWFFPMYRKIKNVRKHKPGLLVKFISLQCCFLSFLSSLLFGPWPCLEPGVKTAADSTAGWVTLEKKDFPWFSKKWTPPACSFNKGVGRTCVDVLRVDVKCVGVRCVCVCHMSRHYVDRWAILKAFSHSLCRIILGMPKLMPCLRA